MKTRALPRRALTPDEITLARALCGPSVRYPAGRSDQRWVRQVCIPVALQLAGATVVTELTAKRLVTLALRMRRQLPADVLTIAERLAGPRPGAWISPRVRAATASLAVGVLTLAFAAGCSNCWAVPGCQKPAPGPAPKDTVTR